MRSSSNNNTSDYISIMIALALLSLAFGKTTAFGQEYNNEPDRTL